jgi:hypothetical protein
MLPLCFIVAAVCHCGRTLLFSWKIWGVPGVRDWDWRVAFFKGDMQLLLLLWLGLESKC